MRLGAKSCTRNGFLIYEEMHKYFQYKEVISHKGMTLHPIPLNLKIYEENFILFFISVLNIPSPSLIILLYLSENISYSGLLLYLLQLRK